LNIPITRILFFWRIVLAVNANAENNRIRNHGIIIGSYPTGVNNSISDVAGIRLGHVTLIKDDNIRSRIFASSKSSQDSKTSQSIRKLIINASEGIKEIQLWQVDPGYWLFSSYL
jgi:hypothetical protein